MSTRILNVLLILLSVVYLVFSSSLVVQHVLYLFIWDWNIPSTLGGYINDQVFNVLGIARLIIFLMMALATLLRRYNKNLYLQTSLKVKWPMILLAILLVVILLHVVVFQELLGINYTQHQLEETLKSKGLLFVVTTVATTLIQLFVVLDCCFTRRKKIKKWIVNK